MDEKIPQAAALAWQAYNDMEVSKDRYFSLREYLDKKYQDFGAASLQEQTELDHLLAEHTCKVKLFRTTVVELKEQDTDAHDAFVKQLSSLGESLTPAPLSRN